MSKRQRQGPRRITAFCCFPKNVSSAPQLAQATTACFSTRYAGQAAPLVVAFGLSRGSNCFENSEKTVSLGITLVLYQTQHSEVSIDRARDFRSQEAAKRRGRWTLLKSMVRFEKSSTVLSHGQKYCSWTRCSGGSRSRKCPCAPTLEGVSVRRFH